MASDCKFGIVPDLAAIAADPGKVSLLPLEAIPGMRAELARLDSLLLMRLFQSGNGQGQAQENGDQLLTAEQAARKLGRSRDHMYRHADQYPFTVRNGRALRFSEAGIEKFIRQRMGR